MRMHLIISSICEFNTFLLSRDSQSQRWLHSGITSLFESKRRVLGYTPCLSPFASCFPIPFLDVIPFTFVLRQIWSIAHITLSHFSSISTINVPDLQPGYELTFPTPSSLSFKGTSGGSQTATSKVASKLYGIEKLELFGELDLEVAPKERVTGKSLQVQLTKKELTLDYWPRFVIVLRLNPSVSLSDERFSCWCCLLQIETWYDLEVS